MQLRSFAFVLFVCSMATIEDEPKQPTIGYRSAPLLTVDGLTFKDLNRNGKLDPYEDWRLPADVRTADLLQRMSLEELAGVMVHGTLPSAGPLAPLGVGIEYHWVKVRQFVEKDHVNTFITRLNGSAEFFAKRTTRYKRLRSPRGRVFQLSSLPIRGTTLSKCWEQAHRTERSPCGRSLWASPRSMIRN